MKKILFLLLFVSSLIYAQKHDYNWILGGRSDSTSANTVVKFDDVLPAVSIATTGFVPMSWANASISDSAGKLLFFTNGINVYNKDFQSIPNAVLQSSFTIPYQNSGLNWSSFVFLPNPGDTNLYTLFYCIPDTSFSNGPCFGPLTAAGMSNHLYFTTLDKRLNGGLGGILSANNIAYTGLLAMNGAGLAATKHANGRDWWLIIKNACDAGYQTFLFTPSGVLHQGQQNAPYIFNQSKVSNSCMFSPDGSMYSMTPNGDELVIYKFDRCTGILSDQLIIPSLMPPNCLSEFSSNSRFLYQIIQNKKIVQYDLLNYNVPNAVSNSGIVVGETDTFNCPIFPVATTTYIIAPRLAPDSKIYIPHSYWCDVTSTIEYPDSIGQACTPLFHNFTLTAGALGTAGIRVNYRLGPIAGSICDSITSIRELDKENVLIYPNPSNGKIKFAFKAFGHSTIEVIGIDSKVLYSSEQNLRGEIERSIDLSKFSDGIYFLRVNSGNKFYVGKFIIE
jgi:hypothetical protein